ncbi:UDP-N-acetylglucosamine 2-epimerase (non-hydrolyzing) [Arcanobacterium pluranimalium]|uniref:non-hydrolyzing UDP-N-acetylglucosamine 2-epimerase n=1 Tax=Arcanobacterium pluranimalium TaxID=108028 RepID=UPI001EF98E52|nr:UDP-N-acetylglucosamine 2-epimerase (non-hydrolyzing) [Arcanobacterium pluranimalium]MBM7824605.1 UDP-N-acetylglucosamine 2-epimerase (non-hydrolyzing) [Arcanobacterium pluranimalium]
MNNIMVVYGTRPEGIKVASLIKEMERSEHLQPIIVSTGQHREMLDQVNRLFDIRPDVDLDIFEHGQTLNRIAMKIFDRLDPVLEEYQPDALLVQGDTSTVAMAAIAAFYREIPVIHLEAGLRSGNIHSPFPEEANRKLTSQIASLHLAPTAEAKTNLLREAIDPSDVVVTGNTVIDALFYTLGEDISFDDVRLNDAVNSGKRILLVTSHRRENIGEPMMNIGRAVQRLADMYPDDLVVFPIHRNPKVRELILPALEGKENVIVIDPLDYPQFTKMLSASHIVLTDSGGVQEEAPSLGKPVLVLRENTERPEAVTAGTVKLIGTMEDSIVHEVQILKESAEIYGAMANAVNPYGDGHAAERCVAAISALLGEGERLPDFEPVN